MPNLHREGADIPERIWYPPVFFGERKDMNNTKNQKLLTLVLAAMFFALGYLLPYATGQIKEIGKMLCPMHLPVLLCGFVCGPVWGLAMFIFTGIAGTEFSFAAFIAGAFTGSIPGIIAQIVLIPPIVMIVERVWNNSSATAPAVQ